MASQTKAKQEEMVDDAKPVVMNNSDSTDRPKAASIIGPGWKIIVLPTYFICIGSLPIMQFGIVIVFSSPQAFPCQLWSLNAKR